MSVLDVKFAKKLQKRLTELSERGIMIMKMGDERRNVMLLQFSCENHKSIKDRITFSTIAGKDTTHESELKAYDNFKVLRMAAIYGANGSGKSNVISALGFAQALVANSMNHQPGTGVFQAPHKLSHPDAPSTYEFHFVKKDIRYVYGFSIKHNLIEEEYLYYFPKKRQVKIL